jgi:hypothetical protein
LQYTSLGAPAHVAKIRAAEVLENFGGTMMREVCAAMAAIAWLAAPALADGVRPLAPGKPVGVAKAQNRDNTVLYVIGAGAIVAGIALLASDNGSNPGSSSSNTTNTSTSTTT